MATKKSLKLNRQTLQALSDNTLANIVGGEMTDKGTVKRTQALLVCNDQTGKTLNNHLCW